VHYWANWVAKEMQEQEREETFNKMLVTGFTTAKSLRDKTSSMKLSNIQSNITFLPTTPKSTIIDPFNLPILIFQCKLQPFYSKIQFFLN